MNASIYFLQYMALSHMHQSSKEIALIFVSYSFNTFRADFQDKLIPVTAMH